MSPPHSQIACTRPTLRDAGSQCGPGNCSGSRQDQTGTTKLPDGLERTKGATACPSPFTSSSAHPGDVTQDTRSAQRGTSGATTGGGAVYPEARLAARSGQRPRPGRLGYRTGGTGICITFNGNDPIVSSSTSTWKRRVIGC